MHSIKKRQRKATLTALLFIFPFFVLFTVFTIYPIIQGVWVSLCKWSLMGFQDYVGLDNFRKLFGDSKFWASLKHTTTFVLSAGGSFGFSRFLCRQIYLRSLQRSGKRHPEMDGAV